MASTCKGLNISLRVLPADLIGRCLNLLEPNDRALNGRLVSKDACRRLSDPLHRTAAFSIPLPSEAAQPAWQQNIHQAFHQLSFFNKFVSLSAASASGSQLNVEIAWAMLQPCLSLRPDTDRAGLEDSGTAAVRHGHLHLLPWLLQHGCPLYPECTVAAAAQHCDLAGLQRVLELLGGDCSHNCYSRRLPFSMGSSAVDAMGKLAWMLSVWQRACGTDWDGVAQEVLTSAARGAASSGNLPVLRWLLQRGMDLRTSFDIFDAILGPSWLLALSGALRNGHVAVADWLVDEAGCPVPQQAHEQQQQWELGKLWDEAAGGGSVEAMRWLLHRAGPPVSPRTVCHAATSGRLEAVRFLHQECGLPLTLLTVPLFSEAAASGSVPLVKWLLQAGCPMSEGAYGSAAQAGQLGMVAWLATEAKCPWAYDTLREVMEAGCPPGDGRVNGDSIGAAARLGLLPLAQHLHEERGVPFASGTLMAAALGGCVPAVEWLVGAGCVAWKPGTQYEYGWDPYIGAGGGGGGGLGDVATLSCLRRLGVPWHQYTLYYAVQERLALRVLRWMVEHGAPWDEDTLYDIVDRCLHCKADDDDAAAWLAERLGFRMEPRAQ